MAMKRRRQASRDGGIWRRECIESIANYIASPGTLVAFLKALPHDALGLPLQSVLTLLQSQPNHQHLWPRLVLHPMSAVDANVIRLLRHASLLFPFVVVRGSWDLDVLRQCLAPSTPIQFNSEPHHTPPSNEWFVDLSTLYVTSLVMDDFYGGFDVPGSVLCVLHRFTFLKVLDMKCTTGLTEFEQDLLFASLSVCPIESLRLKQSPWRLTSSNATRLANWLLYSNRATDLSLEACSVDRHDSPAVVAAMTSSPTLKRLRLVRSNLGRAIGTATLLAPNLHALVLNDAHFTPSSMRNIDPWLSRLVELHLDGNPLRNRGVDRLVQAFLASARSDIAPHLKVLSLASGGIGSNGGEALAAVLPLTYLTSLSIGCNAMGDVAGLALAAVLPRCHHLTTLDVHRLALTDDGVVAIMSALPTCPRLRSVDLSENWTTYVGAVQLVPMLPRCDHVSLLSLAYNPLEGRGVEALMRAMPKQMRLNVTVDMAVAAREQCVELAAALGVADRVTLNSSPE